MGSATAQRRASEPQAVEIEEFVTPRPALPDDAVPAPCGGACDITLRALPAGFDTTMTQDEAVSILFDSGIPFARGGKDRGQTVSMDAAAGLATVGYRSENGQWLNGPLNMPLSDGTTLDHIEDRPVWILDYRTASTAIPGDPLATPTNHVVYIIDIETRTILQVLGYAGD
jgi:hypothetical protein